MPLTTDSADFLKSEAIRTIQEANWARQSEYVIHSSRFYQRLALKGIVPSSLRAFSDFPLTNKEMLRLSQREHPPFGDYLASRPESVNRVHRTSGTSGVAMNLALSRTDATTTAIVGARAQRAAGLGPGFRVVHCLNYQLWMGGFTDHTTLEATGATVVPFGVGDSEKLIRTIQELGINVISCTPSYPAVLERTIASHFPGLAPKDLGLKLGLFGGEAGLDDANLRHRLESTWGFSVRNANYGVSDVFCNFASQTDVCNDLHFLAADVLYPELVDPDSGALLPWREGETGELVLTHLARQCQPLVRFRTGDILTLTGIGTAACGRTAPRFRVVGRSDDMLVVRGLNLFPTMIAEVLNGFPQLSGEYRIALKHGPPYDYLPIEIELSRAQPATDDLLIRIEHQIKKHLGASARVTLAPVHSLPRTEGKTQRVFRSYEDDQHVPNRHQ